MLVVGLTHYLLLSAVLFCIGIVGLFLNRHYLITALLCIELMLLAVNTNCIAFASGGNLHAQVFVFFILTVAAAEVAIGLAILVVLFRKMHHIDIQQIDRLKG